MKKIEPLFKSESLSRSSLKFHPAADAFPMMNEKRYSELVADIQINGQREAITLSDSMILDGRNRYKACLELGIEPTTRTYFGDPWAYVWSLNGQRRDLVAEQRYLCWKVCHEKSEAFQAEQKQITDKANHARSEAANQRQRTRNGTFQPVVGQSVLPVVKEEPGKQIKAAA